MFNILTCSNFGNLRISEELIYVLNKFREWTPGLRGWSPQNQSKTGYCHRLSPKSADYVIIMLSTKMKMKYVSGADPEMCWWRLCLWTTATAVSRSTNQPTNHPTICNWIDWCIPGIPKFQTILFDHDWTYWNHHPDWILAIHLPAVCDS